MKKVSIKSWKRLRDVFLDFARQPLARREQFLFRGHASAGWELEPTLDRTYSFQGDEDRSGVYLSLLREFKNEGYRSVANPYSNEYEILERTTMSAADHEHADAGVNADYRLFDTAFHLVARHHGVPSPFLDWTGSPYVAAFFAFEWAGPPRTDSVAIWVCDRESLPIEALGHIQFFDEPEHIRYNPRALRQKGRFLWKLTSVHGLEQLLGSSLTKINVPAVLREEALADLDAMGINAGSLFADLDHAARTAVFRVGRSEKTDRSSRSRRETK